MAYPSLSLDLVERRILGRSPIPGLFFWEAFIQTSLFVVGAIAGALLLISGTGFSQLLFPLRGLEPLGDSTAVGGATGQMGVLLVFLLGGIWILLLVVLQFQIRRTRRILKSPVLTQAWVNRTMYNANR
jgi:hypothetical protein